MRGSHNTSLRGGSKATNKGESMKKLLIITWLAALAFCMNAFAEDTQVTGEVLKATNLTVSTTPVLLVKKTEVPFANVIRIESAGVQTLKLCFISTTNLTANNHVTNVLSGSLGTVLMGAVDTNTLNRSHALGLWRGSIWAASSAADTNAVKVLILK